MMERIVKEEGDNPIDVIKNNTDIIAGSSKEQQQLFNRRGRAQLYALVEDSINDL